jgi:ATP-binding protein involved in chromosome partitioning
MSDTIKNLILIASGKGGVGKSTIAANLALALARQGAAVGLLDADVHGPSIPTMFGGAPKPESDGERLLPIDRLGLKLMSMGYLVDGDVAMIWRGPMMAGAASQLMTEVAWGELDYLVVDLPPGTGDIQLTLAQKFKVTGAVLVTTPQTVAIADVRRAKTMFDKVQIPTIGLIENMSYFVCPGCNTRHEIFAHGGGERAASDMGVSFLGRVPLEPRVRECGDAGEPVVSAAPDSESAKSFVTIAAAFSARVATINSERAKAEGRRRALPVIQG